MLYVITILLLVILLASEISRELLITHVGQPLDMAALVILLGGLFILLFVVMTLCNTTKAQSTLAILIG